MKNRIHLYLVPGILLVFSSCILPVNAQVTSTGTSPQVIFDDTDEDGFEWAFTGDQDFFRLFNVDSNGFLIDFDDQADMQLDMKPTTFQIQDQSSNDIFRVHRDAPLSLDIQSDGDVFFGNKIGIGTTTPAVDLDIKSAKPVIFFHDTTVGSADWIVGNNANDFVFTIDTNGTGGPVAADIMTLDAETGFVGVGINPPTAPLHVKDNRAGFPQLFHIENTGSDFAGFRFTTTGGAIDFSKAGGNSFRINILDGDTWELQVDPAGNLNIKGQIITAGSCSGGCDRVFAPDYELPTIETHAAAMWNNRYLPEVGPTEEGQPINLSDKTESMLNELEKAHIYIEQLHTRNVSLEQKVEEMQQSEDESVQRAKSMEQRVAELERQNQRIEQLVTRLVTNQAEQVAIN